MVNILFNHRKLIVLFLLMWVLTLELEVLLPKGGEGRGVISDFAWGGQKISKFTMSKRRGSMPGAPYRPPPLLMFGPPPEFDVFDVSDDFERKKILVQDSPFF